VNSSHFSIKTLLKFDRTMWFSMHLHVNMLVNYILCGRSVALFCGCGIDKVKLMCWIWTTLSITNGLNKRKNCLPFASTWFHHRLLVGSVLLISLVFCVVLCFCFFWFCLSSFCVLYTQYCQWIWNFHSWLCLRFSLAFILWFC